MKITNELLELIDKAVERLGIQHLIDKIYKAIDSINARGTDKATAVATAIYIACKENAEPITITKICKAVGTSQSKVFKLLKKHGVLVDLTTPEQYIEPLLQRLGIADKESIKEVAKDYLKLMEKVSAPPLVKSATAIYLASVKLNIPLTQQKLEEVTGVTEVSVRSMITRLFGERSDKSIRTILKNN